MKDAEAESTVPSFPPLICTSYFAMVMGPARPRCLKDCEWSQSKYLVSLKRSHLRSELETGLAAQYKVGEAHNKTSDKDILRRGRVQTLEDTS